MINVAIIDGDTELNHITFSILKNADAINVAAQFYSGKDFINALPSLQVRVALIDINLPSPDFINFIKAAKNLRPDIDFIVTSAWVQPDLIFKTICAGASGYISKFGNKNYFINTIRELANEQAQLSLPIAQLINTGFLSQAVSTFTAMQSKIISLIAKGFSYNDVCTSITLNHETVLKEIAHIYKRLHNISY